MAAHQILIRQKAIALQRAIETTESLLGEESQLLHSAQHDVTGRSMDGYAITVLVAELTRVVAAQQERIEELEARLPEEVVEEPEEISAK